MALQLRPKGATAQDRVAAHDDAGEKAWRNPRGFYLRASFTRAIFDRALFIGEPSSEMAR